MKFHACVAIASYFLAVKAFTPSVYNFLGSDGKTAISELSSYFDINQDGVISLKEYQYGLAEAVEKGYAPAGILDNAGGLVCAVDGEVEVKVPVFQKCITKKFKKMKVSDWLQSKAYRGFDLDAAVVLAVNDKRRQKCGPNAPEVSDVDLQKCRNRSECIKALMECPSENESFAVNDDMFEEEKSYGMTLNPARHHLFKRWFDCCGCCVCCLAAIGCISLTGALCGACVV